MILSSLLCVFILTKAASSNPIQNIGDAPLFNKGLFQGDIAGYDPDTNRASILDTDKLWPEGIVHYVIGPSAVGLRDYILDGIEEYHQKTCIRFVERTTEVEDYIQIEQWQGCSSMLGRMGGRQYLSLGSGCHYKGLVVHELAHALGFLHEQARSDRDDYIEVIWDNIKEEYKSQFLKMQPFEHNLLNEHFDYSSVMLYEETAFSIDGVLPTVRVKQADTIIGPVWQKTGLSESDVRRVNKLYQCFGEVRPPPPDVPDFLCDFETHDCGVVNQDNMGSSFELINTDVGGVKGSVLLANLKNANSVAARLITPHFSLYGRQEGCFTFDYFFNGDGVHSLTVDKQSSDTIKVLIDEEPSNEWKKAHIPVFKKEGDTRFFITAIFKSDRDITGLYAVDNIGFKLGSC